MPNITALLLMGGSGKRFKESLPKQFHRLSGKPIYLHTLQRFCDSHLFSEILLVCHEDWIERVVNEVQGFKYPIRVISGGQTRQESSYLGIKACSMDTDFVLIHDAVRPFVSLSILQNNCHQAQIHGAVDTCIASTDTIITSSSGLFLDSIPPRKTLMRGQTPQTFRYDLIKKAHVSALQEGIQDASDDCQLVKRLNACIGIVQGHEENIKITTELDLFIAEQLLRKQTHTSTPAADGHTLKGKIFALTGGTGGIGRAIQVELESKGAQVLCISRSSQEFPCDLTSFVDTQSTFKKINDLYGPLDGLIHSVGFLKLCSIQHMTETLAENLIKTNFTSLVYSTQNVVLKPNAHIINIASSSYFRGRKDYAIYSSMKAASVNFMQGLSEEWPHLFINTLIPQRTNTAMRRENFPEEDITTLLSPSSVAKAMTELLCTQDVTGSIFEIKF